MDETNLPVFPRYGPPLDESSASPERPPSPAPPAPPAPHPNDREQRLAALRALAGSTSASPTKDATGDGTTTRSPRRALFAAIIALLLVAGSVGAYLHSRPAGKAPATTPSIPTTVTLNAGTGHVGCPSNIAWSPDGRRMAVLAVLGNSCAATEPVGLIFDTHTGKPLTTLDLSSALAAQHLSGVITSVTWAPDGTSVLFGGVVGSSTPTQYPTVEPALYSFDVDGTVGRLLVGAPIPAANSNLTGAIWDVSAGREVHAITSALPLALSYRWTSDGRIIAAQPLPSPTSTPSPSSAPDGTLVQPNDGTFSAWQPGTFVPIMAWDTAHDAPDFLAPPRAEGYLTTTNQWSPDGRYLAIGLHTQQLVPPEPGQPLPKLNPSACNTAGFIPPRSGCPRQATPLPDATLASIAQLAKTGTHFHGPNGATGLFWSPVPVAWRADGSWLATILPDDGFNSGGQEYVISLFRADETQSAARLSLSCPGMPCRFQWQPGNAGLSWSPTGTQLALLDPDSGLITIWGGSALSK